MNKIKKIAFTVLAGGMVLGGGCLGGGGGWWQQVLWGAAISIGTDFATDNDAVFDLFEDGEPTAAAE